VKEKTLSLLVSIQKLGAKQSQSLPQECQISRKLIPSSLRLFSRIA